MSAINIDLIYGNRYYTTKIDKEAEAEMPEREAGLRSDCPSDPGKGLPSKGKNCVRKAEGMLGMPL